MIRNGTRNENPSNHETPDLRNTIRPTLFIGLGSTGAKIVSRLKALINSEGNQGLANDFLSYFIITSEVTPEQGVDRNIGSYVFSTHGLTGRTAVETFTQHRGPNQDQVRDSFHKWWSFDKNGDPWIPPVNDAGIGAGGIRALGRLLLHMRCMDVKLVDRIRQEVEAFRNKKENLPPHLRHMVNEKSISVYVFGLLAGGTCSGSVADVALLVRTALPQSMIHGVFLMGDICYSGANVHELDPRKVTAQKKNTEHALAELTILQTETGRQIALRNWVRLVGRCRISEDAFDTKPFFKIALVGAANDHGYKLQSFAEYIEFVARFHALIYTTGAYQEQIGRAIDEQSQNVTSWDCDFPGRPNNFVRLGLMNIEIPKDRVLAVARHQIANTLALTAFQEVDEARCEVSRSRFFNEVQWSRLDSDFLPDVRSFVPTFEGRLSGPEEFKEIWEAAKADADRYLEGWYASDSPEAEKRIETFLARLDLALENVLDDFLGQAEDRPVSFGSLECLLSSLLEAVNAQIATNAEEREALEEALFRQGGIGNRFETALVEHIEGYPSWLRRFIIRRFNGNDDLADLLEAYQKQGRAYCGYVMLDRALILFRQRLLAMFVAKKLITGDEGVRHFFASVQHQRDLAYREDVNQLGMRQGVLERMSELKSVFVDPLLEGRVGADSQVTRGDAAHGFTLQNWTGNEGRCLVDSFRELVRQLYPDRRNTRSLTFDQAITDAPVMDQVDGLVRGIRSALDAAEECILRPVIEETSVWEGIRRYLRLQAGTDVDATLKGLFSGYANRAAFFPRLGAHASADSFEPARYNYFICRVEDAQAAFEQLNLPAPETYLDTLFTHAFGYYPQAIASDRSSFALSILRMIEGELPTNYEGYEELSKILSVTNQEEVEVAQTRKTWSDWRFPQWILEWHHRGGAEFLIPKPVIQDASSAADASPAADASSAAPMNGNLSRPESVPPRGTFPRPYGRQALEPTPPASVT